MQEVFLPKGEQDGKIFSEDGGAKAMKRDEIFEEIWEQQDLAYELMTEYDSMPHRYSEDVVLYQAEGELVDEVALHPDITVTELARILKKTPSACSQLIRKLKAKGIVAQIRNTHNNREYYLELTEFGQKVFKSHVAFSEMCQEKMKKMLEKFTDEELTIALYVQQTINEAYQDDVENAHRYFLKPGFCSKDE